MSRIQEEKMTKALENHVEDEKEEEEEEEEVDEKNELDEWFGESWEDVTERVREFPAPSYPIEFNNPPYFMLIDGLSVILGCSSVVVSHILRNWFGLLTCCIILIYDIEMWNRSQETHKVDWVMRWMRTVVSHLRMNDEFEEGMDMTERMEWREGVPKSVQLVDLQVFIPDSLD